LTQRQDSLDFDKLKNKKDRFIQNDMDLICQPNQIFDQAKVNVFFKSKVTERSELVSLLKELKLTGFERISLELTKKPLKARKAIRSYAFFNRLSC
jgi:hypothetical protein